MPAELTDTCTDIKAPAGKITTPPSGSNVADALFDVTFYAPNPSGAWYYIRLQIVNDPSYTDRPPDGDGVLQDPNTPNRYYFTVSDIPKPASGTNFTLQLIDHHAQPWQTLYIGNHHAT